MASSGRVPPWAAPLAIGLAVALASGTPSAGLAGPLAPSAGSPLVGPKLLHRVAVFGPDERVSLPGEHRALERSIGLLYERRTRTVCSAFCVGDATIATASHCVYRTRGEKAPDASGFTFRFSGRLQGSTVTRVAGAAAGAAAQHMTAGAFGLRIEPPIDASSDWALIRLARPVCKGAVLPVSRREPDQVAALADERRIYQVAFHRDFAGWRLAYGAPCPLRKRPVGDERKAIARDFSHAENLMLHTCDTGGASSGSPLLVDGANGPEVVGINVGTYVQTRILTRQGEVVHRYQSETIANTAVATDAFSDQLDRFLDAEFVATKAGIRDLQRALAAEGHYKGPLNGTYSRELRQAIADYERAAGRRETGLATMRLLAELKAKHPAPVAAETGTGGLVTGSVGSHKPTRARKP